MITKIPVPMTLIKSSLGIRHDDDVIKLSVVSEDMVYLYTNSDGPAAGKLTGESQEPRLEVNYAVGAHETS